MSDVASRGALRVGLELLRAGAGAVALHPLRSGVTVTCVVALVLPYVVGTGISRGLRDEMEQAVEAGPDLHVTALRFGRTVPVPLDAAEMLRDVPGVTEVVPRIVGEMRIGRRRESAVVVGLPADALPPDLALVDGRLFAAGAVGELVVGSELSQRLGLRVGDAVPPFYRSESGERVSRVVGVFRTDAPLWQAHVIFVSLETAWQIFGERGSVTSFLLRCPETYCEPVAQHIRTRTSLGPEGRLPSLRPRVATRDDTAALFLRRALDRETLFQLPFILAFAVGVPIVLVTSGAGLVERRREAGLLRAIGWSRDALLVRAFVESVLLAVLGAAAAVLLAFVWLRAFNGAGIAPVLLPGAGRVPGFRVPWRLAAEPVVLAFIVSGVMVAAGTLHSTWRAATASASAAMR